MKIISLLLIVSIAVTTMNGQTIRAKSALLTGDEAKRLAKQCSRDSPSDFTDTWKPSVDELTEMEKKFDQISLLKANCCIEGLRVDNPNAWYMQYAALIWKGKKIVYISALSTEEPKRGICVDKNGIVTDEHCESWKVHAQIVCDAVTGWGVVYDVAAGKFSDLAM